ncbi:helix-turn-helix domain-containing protein [Gloeobacter kilaueensis]|uniref:Uncharacterized protein n=1 Tax=Gloeobacter kilaueensis (strain ATCC BAA-2537 / CCAP 1431/1 / ULC 316 / JS1) TaxID=1183438 RepID=U5QLW7_GLOK1|nr:helix-turn-helix domain-containing protein [Gloeobacter kilaueensis]AGY59901.1 hypothetical protein GKIL_3655 [Gloeobacter kilaueensis JS1]
MNTQPPHKSQAILAELVSKAGYRSVTGFCRAAGIGRSTARRLQQGQITAIRLESLQRIAGVLALDLPALIEQFLPTGRGAATDWRFEYERLREQTKSREAQWREAWDLNFYRSVELLLLQLPTIRRAADERSDLTARSVLDLLLPFDEFVAEAGFEPVGAPGEVIRFDPQQHQGAGLAPGTAARIKTVGYRYRGQLLTRARVVAL